MRYKLHWPTPRRWGTEKSQEHPGMEDGENKAVKWVKPWAETA